MNSHIILILTDTFVYVCMYVYVHIYFVIQMEELRNKAEKDLKIIREMVSVYNVCTD